MQVASRAAEQVGGARIPCGGHRQRQPDKCGHCGLVRPVPETAIAFLTLSFTFSKPLRRQFEVPANAMESRCGPVERVEARAYSRACVCSFQVCLYGLLPAPYILTYFSVAALYRASKRLHALVSTLALRWALSHTPSSSEVTGASDRSEAAMGSRGPAPVNLTLPPRDACSAAAPQHIQGPLEALVSLVLVSGCEL